MNKYKKNGYLLIELMLALSIFSFILVSLNKIYITVNTNVNFLRNNCDVHINRMQTTYNINLDLMGAIFSSDALETYKNIKELNKNKDNAKEKENSENKLKAEFEKFSNYFFNLENNNNEISLTWITTKDNFSKEGRNFVKVKYFFEEVENNINEKTYSLKRSEFDFDANKFGKSYIIISYIINPSIKIIRPKIKTNNESQENELNKENSKKNEKNNFKEWKKTSLYEMVLNQKIEDPTLLQNNFPIPNKVIFDGEILSPDNSKRIPLNIFCSVPIFEHCLEEFLNSDKKIEIMEKKNKKPSSNKKPENKEDENDFNPNEIKETSDLQNLET